MEGAAKTSTWVTTDAIRLLRSAHNVGRALDTGVTTVCDCGGWNQTTFRLKEGIQQGVVRGSRVLASGRPDNG